MSFTIAPAARLELIEAAVWYDDIRLGLGPMLICKPAEFLGGLNDGQE